MHALLVALLLGFTPPPAGLHVQTDGKAVFDQSCRKCHGVRGVPSASMKRMMKDIPVLDAPSMSKLTLAAVVDAIRKGKGDMKPFEGKLSDEQIDAVATYVFELANTKPQVAKSGK